MSDKTSPKAPGGNGHPGGDDPSLPRHRRPAAAVKLNPTFDAWLETKLHHIFDTAATEPLPQDLVKLLDQIDKADAAKDGAKSPGASPVKKASDKL